MVGAVGIDNPEIRIAFVRRGVRKPTHVDDFLSVGGNLRVRGGLDLKLIHGRELVRSVLRSH